ncbi:hypothetical protein GCM10010274_29740 [Streptomyces lavendofoliae]|uniref:Uncharacterized protein n=1 Tax=Streptomyces lavendofoliae TaxID=67314 RepID=A0A918HYT5_9ACTN|nr:hypothetical protein GCM10010274_29740 [Streptomyces lavendofoliae]
MNIRPASGVPGRGAGSSGEGAATGVTSADGYEGMTLTMLDGAPGPVRRHPESPGRPNAGW